MKLAYLRVSSTSQSLEIQREAVSKLNIQKIFEEKGLPDNFDREFNYCQLESIEEVK